MPVFSRRTPTATLLLGLIVTLATVLAYSWYISRQITGLRQLQTDLTDRSRRDSLQLLRIQGDLNQLALAMRDMLDPDETYPINAWSSQFDRIRDDLDDALKQQESVAIARRTPEQARYLASSVSQFWDAAARIFELAASGKETDARSQVRLSLQPRQAALSTTVARFLVQNNESEAQTAAQVQQIYATVQREVRWFLLATLAAIVATGIVLIRSSQRLFGELASLSDQQHELALQLIGARESTLREIARELHDEFGQILTAIGSMLGRAGRQAPEGSALRSDLREIAEVAQDALDNVRGLSQSLHPSVLSELGLGAAVDWYMTTVERQLGLTVQYRAVAADAGARRDDGDSHLPDSAGGLEQRGTSLGRDSSARPPALGRHPADARRRGCRQRGRRQHGPPRARPGDDERARGAGGWCIRACAGRCRRYTRSAARSCRNEAGVCMSASISVLLVDDHALVRRGFRRMLEDDPAITVVGEASNGDEAVARYAEQRPDVVVMDSAMPGMGGIAATRAILAAHPDARILMLSMHSEDTLVRQALDAGARGYVLKSALDLDLAAAVKQVHAGDEVVDPAVLKSPQVGEERSRLTPREHEVLQLICNGLSNKEIRRAARTEREYRGGPSRPHHERARRPQDGGTGHVRPAARAHQPAVNRREFLHGASLAFAGATFTLSEILDAQAGPGFRLVDVTRSAGITFTHNNGAFGGKFLPETLGSGCAFLDYDGDGWQDIVLVNGMDWPGHRRQRSTLALYRNNRNGTFTDVTKAAGLDVELYGMGVAVGDFNNDGFPDLFITCVGQSRLFRNTGKGTFVDVTVAAGLGKREAFSTSAMWVDIDRDGHLDLFVCNYVRWSPDRDVFCSLDGRQKSVLHAGSVSR
ncbi:MAG: response regulator [Vicinamibacterales bacterium]